MNESDIKLILSPVETHPDPVEIKSFIASLTPDEHPRWMMMRGTCIRNICYRFNRPDNINLIILDSFDIKQIIKPVREYTIQTYNKFLYGKWDDTTYVIVLNTAKEEYDDETVYQILRLTRKYHRSSALFLSSNILTNDICINVIRKLYQQFTHIIVLGSKM